MEPNWQPRQGEGAARPSAWHEPSNSQAQRPLGAAVRQPAGPRYTGPVQPAGSYWQPGEGQASGAYQPQQHPGQGSSQPWASTGGQAFTGGMQPSDAYQPPQSWGPTPADPFEEPAEAPELRSQRSDHLYARDDRFWDHVEDVDQMQPLHTAPQVPVRPKADSHTLRWVLLILAVLVAVGLLVYSAVFQVRTIEVEGASAITREEIIRLSGISEGMNTFTIDDDAVERGIESNRYLSFVCVDKQLPDKVVLQVKERTQAAVVKYCGILYIIDNRGMVLEESLNTDATWDNLVSVEGLDIKQCRVGESIVLNNPQQMQVYTELMVELKVMSALEDVKELDLTDMDNLFLVSRDEYSVRMGNSEKLHAKLRSMLMTRERLNRDGYQNKGGTIDVSAPVNPTYIPESI